MSEEQTAMIEALRQERIGKHKQAFRDSATMGILRWMGDPGPPRDPQLIVTDLLEAWEASNKVLGSGGGVIDEAEMLGLNLPESAAVEIERTAILAAEKAIRDELGRSQDEEDE